MFALPRSLRVLIVWSPSWSPFTMDPALTSTQLLSAMVAAAADEEAVRDVFDRLSASSGFSADREPNHWPKTSKQGGASALLRSVNILALLVGSLDALEGQPVALLDEAALVVAEDGRGQEGVGLPELVDLSRSVDDLLKR